MFLIIKIYILYPTLSFLLYVLAHELQTNNTEPLVSGLLSLIKLLKCYNHLLLLALRIKSKSLYCPSIIKLIDLVTTGIILATEKARKWFNFSLRVGLFPNGVFRLHSNHNQFLRWLLSPYLLLELLVCTRYFSQTNNSILLFLTRSLRLSSGLNQEIISVSVKTVVSIEIVTGVIWIFILISEMGVGMHILTSPSD